MVMLSRLLRHRLADLQGRRAALLDLGVDVSAGDYPPVTRLFYQGADRQPFQLPWEEVQSGSWHDAVMTVRDLSAGRPATSESMEKSVLLRRDVMDALVLDLTNCQATRANDLWLYEREKQLSLVAADIGPWAVFRRLGRGLLGAGSDRNLVDWKDVEFLRGDPRTARAGGDYHRRVTRLQPAEITRLVDAMPYLHAAELLTLLPEPLAADALELMSVERQLQVFEELSEDQASGLLALMAPDGAADLLGRLKPELAEAHVTRLPELRREQVIELLRYAPTMAGGIMTNDIVVAPAGLSVKEARAKLVEPLKSPDFVYYIYVVDDEAGRHLNGVLTLRDFLVADDNQRLGEIADHQLITIDPLEPAVEAARRVADHHLVALPVVARDGRLLGAVTVDAAMAQIAPAGWRGDAPRVFS